MTEAEDFGKKEASEVEQLPSPVLKHAALYQ